MNATQTIETTRAQFDRTHKVFKELAQADGTTELIGGCFYFFTSEVGSLRLLKKYRTVSGTDCGFSKNLNAYYFRIEGNFSGNFTTDWHK